MVFVRGFIISELFEILLLSWQPSSKVFFTNSVSDEKYLFPSRLVCARTLSRAPLTGIY